MASKEDADAVAPINFWTYSTARWSLRDSQSRISRNTWADSPWPLIMTPGSIQPISHPATYIANEVANLYNAMLRTMNSIYLQAPHVSASKDVEDLLFLTQCWSTWVLNYHVMKASQLFPAFDGILVKGSELTNLDRNYVFMPALQTLRNYAEKTHPIPETYEDVILRGLIEELAPSFHAQISAEIPALMTLQDLCGHAGSIEAEEKANKLLQVYSSCESHVANTMEPFIVPPMLVRSRDTTYEGGNVWPRLTVLAVHQIDDKLSPMHAGAWRFLPCNVWGKPRALPFLGEDKSKGKETVRWALSEGSSESEYSI